QHAEVITRIGTVEVAIEAQVLPAALALPGNQPFDRGARDHNERDALADIGCIAFPGAEQVGAHRARSLALRPEHVAVDRKRLFVVEQSGDIGRSVLALEAIVAHYLATGRQRPPLRGDA